MRLITSEGVALAIENLTVEPDEIDHRFILDFCAPYLGEVVGEYTDWTPLQDRETLFAEDVDRADPWRFKNVRVA